MLNLFCRGAVGFIDWLDKSTAFNIVACVHDCLRGLGLCVYAEYGLPLTKEPGVKSNEKEFHQGLELNFRASLGFRCRR